MMDMSSLSSMLFGLVWSHGYASLSRIYDLSAYAYPTAGLLGLLVLSRRKALRRWRVAVAVAVLVVTCGTYWLRDRIRDRVGIDRLEVLSSMHDRPGDPWPRGSTHVPLGRIGSPESEKGYLEPGGSFSPSPGSFGISFWVVRQDGEMIVTSDDIPLHQTHASYELSASGEPAIRVETAYYTALWTAKDDSSFDLALTASVKPEDRKSTRLNSSHQIISYAVFCLKKKKTQAPIVPRQLGTARRREDPRGGLARPHPGRYRPAAASARWASFGSGSDRTASVQPSV